MSEPITAIAAHSTIKGELHLDGPGAIAGRIQGDIIAHDTLELSAESVVNGNIQGTTVAIHGTVKGNVTASQACQLGPTARVAGDIRAADLAMAKGARFIGHVCVGEIDPPAKPVPVENRAEDAVIQTVAATIAHVEQLAAHLKESAPPATAPAAPNVQILSENLDAALRRGPRIIKAR